jgi:adenylate cyclase class IV
VKGLGTFVEIEAIDTDGSIGKEKLLEQCNMYLKLFEINESDLLNNSYSDQVMKLSAQ